MDRAWGRYEVTPNVVNKTALDDEPRAVAAIMAHEITHATQGARRIDRCLDSEVEAWKVTVNAREASWPNQTPPERTELGTQLGHYIRVYRRVGDPGLRAFLEAQYGRECGGH